MARLFVGLFTMLSFSCFQLLDSLSLKNTDELIITLAPFHGQKCFVCSVDIKDLYFSLEETVLRSKLKQLLELNLVSFQSGARIAIEELLCLPDFYLKSTVIDLNQKYFVQKSGICTGSSLPPALAECYLNSLDICVTKFVQLCSGASVLVTKYVDKKIKMST